MRRCRAAAFLLSLITAFPNFASSAEDHPKKLNEPSDDCVLYVDAEFQNNVNFLESFLSNPPIPLTGDLQKAIEHELAAVRSNQAKLKGEASDVIQWIDGREEVIGSVDRAIIHRLGLLHRATVAFILLPSSAGKELLLNEFYTPQPEDEVFVIGGHVKRGQGYRETILREIVEELGFPEDHYLEGTLSQVATEGGFEIATENQQNHERTSAYLYEVSEREAIYLRHYAKTLALKRSQLKEPAFTSWLAEQQKDKLGQSTGLGEIRALHFPSLASVLSAAGRSESSLKVDGRTLRYHSELAYYLRHPSMIQALERANTVSIPSP